MSNVVNLKQKRRPELSDDVIDAAMCWAFSEPLRLARRVTLEGRQIRMRLQGDPEDFIRFYSAVYEQILEDDAETAAELRKIASRDAYVPTWRDMGACRGTEFDA